ncbi:hypothetical protein H9W90_10930 [Polaribacter pectinis]|uniref:Uncharacterized protein n=1 Tax=Polaribacter pectinis TaxID=2738844 RepID=A0A7G9L7V9_9FLAO|nr:hypothetical protein [Polaribacter pectinis]QNM84708.1 hypothetical protein H9W90_10930 [Polaribacter pectinis]
MKKTYILTLTLFLSISLTAQQKDLFPKILPPSIYTFSLMDDINDVFPLNKKLNLTNFNFAYVNQIDLELNTFSIDSNNFGKQPTEFIYDDYKRYQDRNLLKGFILKNDPTRWAPTNFKTYNQLIKEL